MSIRSKIQSLITAANAKTGESDTTLTDAVQTLVDGYGQGGGVTTQPLSVTENGTYTAPSGTAYTPVTVNVPTGGSLPSVISKIDGGSFTFASDTASTYGISHSLGTTPKGFVIWTEEIDLANAGNNTIIRGVFVVDKTVNNETSYLYQMGVYNHNFNNYSRATGASYSGYANSNTISYNVGNIHYASGINYKWLAWA